MPETIVFLATISVVSCDGRVVKALDLKSNGRIVRVGSNPTPGNNFVNFFFLYKLFPFPFYLFTYFEFCSKELAILTQ